MNTVEKAELHHNTTKMELENAWQRYYEATKEMDAQIKKLEEKREAIHDKMVKPFVGRKELAEKAMWKAKSDYRDERTQDLLYGVPSIERMQELCKFIHFESVRFIKHDSRLDVSTYGFTDYGKVVYVAFKGGKLISALRVDKASHRGDTTYTYAYGIKEISKDSGGFSRHGYSMREWMNPEYVQYIGMTPKEKDEFEKDFLKN